MEVGFRIIDSNGAIVFDSSRNKLNDIVFPGSRQLRRNTVIRIMDKPFVIREIYVDQNEKFVVEVIV